MLDWFRSWHGAPTDPKWLVIAKRAGVPPISVSAIAWALFDHASQQPDRGHVGNFDFESYAVLMGADEDQVRAVYAAMEAKEIIVSGRIAQWDKRQPKREDSSGARMQKLRSKAAQSQLPLSEASEPEEDKPALAEPAPEISAPESKPEPEVLITPEATSLANEVAAAVGHDLEFVPPAWCGAPYRVQTWLDAGWQPQLILQSIKAQMARKRDGPPDRIQYFEKGIARAIAEQSQPLPTVVPFPTETIQARHGRQSPITAAADRLIAELESGGSTGSESAPRLLPQR